MVKDAMESMHSRQGEGQMNRQTNRPRDRWTNIQTNGQLGNTLLSSDMRMYTLRDIITMSNSQYCPTLSGEQTYRQMEMDRQTDRQTR